MSDVEDIKATVADYWWGWFDGDALRIESAMHPDLAKRGVGTDELGDQRVLSMTAGDMTVWAQRGDGVRERPADTSYRVTVDDVYGLAATVTVRSGIYREYLHLVKTNETWRILNALYQRV